MKLFSLILFLGICIQVSAQTDFDPRLLAKFDKVQLQQLAENNSPVLDYWSYYLDNGYKIIDIPAGKTASAMNFPEVKYKSKDSFNVLDLGESMNAITKKYFRIKGTNQLLLLYSRDEFSELFNAHRLNASN